MANHRQQQQKKNSDKIQRKLTKSPQVSCDISMLSASPTISSTSSQSFSFTSPKYIAYPSSLPNNHYNDECLMKNFEYLRSDYIQTSDEINTTVPSPVSVISDTATKTIPLSSYKTDVISPKKSNGEDFPTVFHHYPNIPYTNVIETTQQHHDQPTESDYTIRNNEGMSMVSHFQPSISKHHNEQLQNHKINAVSNITHMPVTIPTCCLKTSLISDGINKQPPTPHCHPNILPIKNPAPQYHILQTSPSLSSAPSIINDQIRHIKQMFQSSTGTSYINNNSATSNNKTNFSNTTKDHLSNEHINHNPFTFGNIFKSCDKTCTTTIQSTATITTISQSEQSLTIAVTSQYQHPPLLASILATPPTAISPILAATPLPPTVSSSSSTGIIGNSNSVLSENVKRDEFLKATMKICLVVSPPSNKLLQVHPKYIL